MALEAKKSLGQHFLNSPVIPRTLCDAGGIEEGDTVVEVGPGTGVLTKELLARGATVVALEADERAITVLSETFPVEIREKKLLLYHTDVRTFDPNDFDLTDGAYKVVSNIPYYLSGMLFRIFLETTKQPTHIVFLTQKEVAKRVTESVVRGGKESLLSLSVQLYGTPTYIQTVARSHFSPQPKVDSGIVLISSIHHAPVGNTDAFFELLHLGFGQKRKQLLGNLTKIYDRNILEGVFDELDLSKTIRAEDVGLPDWIKLFQTVRKEG